MALAIAKFRPVLVQSSWLSRIRRATRLCFFLLNSKQTPRLPIPGLVQLWMMGRWESGGKHSSRGQELF